VIGIAASPAGPTIAGAVNVPLDVLSDAVRAGQLDEFIDGHVAVVCASGQRSAQATVRLSKVRPSSSSSSSSSAVGLLH
jgi:rhodanese-related sulfurtransferase